MKTRTALLGSLAVTVALAGAGAAAIAPAAAAPVAAPPGFRDVMWVGNNWAGTATVVDEESLEVLKSGVNLIPDKAQELRDIRLSPVRLVLFALVRQLPGEGHDQFVDDMFMTPDGTHLAVSRPSFGDVVWIDVAKATSTGGPDSITREQSMDGYRTDHMAVSPDGRRLLVSDSTKRQVLEYSMVDETVGSTEIKMGDRLRTFVSGETPHESNYTADGERILHASIGRVYTPLDDTDPVDGRLLGVPLTRLGISRFRLDKLVAKLPWDVLDEAVKADRWLQYVDTDTFEVLERWDMKHELAEAGFPGMSSAVRPVALHPDGRRLYLQVSFLHGYVEFDTEAADLNGTTDYTVGTKSEPGRGAVTGVVQLENRVPGMPYEQYVNDSAHHGIAISEDGETLCVAGTMDNYAALVDADTGAAQYFDARTTGMKYGKPYWVTEGLGDTCWVSLSDNDAVAVLSTETKKQLAYLPVGNHPQRVRHGYVDSGLLP